LAPILISFSRRDHDRVGAVLAAGGDLVAGRKGTAVADKGEDLCARPAQRRGNRHRHARAHRTHHRGEKDLLLPETDIAVDEAREIAGVRRHSGIGGEVLVNLADEALMKAGLLDRDETGLHADYETVKTPVTIQVFDGNPRFRATTPVASPLGGGLPQAPGNSEGLLDSVL
jgi:hypothetical protein